LGNRRANLRIGIGEKVMSWFRNLIGKAENVVKEVEKEISSAYTDVEKEFASFESKVVGMFKGRNVHVSSNGHIDETTGGTANLTITVEPAPGIAGSTTPIESKSLPPRA